MKSKHIVFVPGLFGWGPGELGGLPYWGGALDQFPDFIGREAKCGPISSLHDRACEVFAYIRGTRVDYGAEHSAEAGHSQFSRDYTGHGIVGPDWSARNPIILVGHSAGATTCLKLHQLLADGFFGKEPGASWVEAIICVSGPLNGSLLSYIALDKATGRLQRAPEFLWQSALDFIALLRLATFRFHDVGRDYDLFLDQWTDKGTINPEFAKGEDNLGFDLSLQGSLKRNQRFRTASNTYYFSLVSRATHGGQIDDSINPLLKGPARFQLEVNFPDAPIPNWGTGDLAIEKWRENDGAASTISQRFPFTAGAPPIGGQGILERDPATIGKGKWYFENIDAVTGMRFDHFDPVIGARLKSPETEAAQLMLYAKLGRFLREL